MPKITSKGIYRMPAEWEPQKSTWIAWPHNRKDWPGKFNHIPFVFGKIISELSKVQLVNILVRNRYEKNKAVFFLKIHKGKISNIKFIMCNTDRAWTRDFLPIFIKDKKNRKFLTNWEFNAWAKYNNFKKDNKAYIKVKKFTNTKLLNPKYKNKKVVLEGGSIDVNGSGYLLTTKQCLLSKIQQRNKGLNENDYYNIFNKYFGIKKIIWLNKGIDGDDTHGHIDDIARFVEKNKIFIGREHIKKERNFKNLYENIKIIQKFRKKENKKLKIVYLPMPKPKFIEGIRVPASYLNFYIANKIVLVPIFNDAKDKVVLKIFKKHFKNRKIIPIDCSLLVWGFGTIHCLTQQQPK